MTSFEGICKFVEGILRVFHWNLKSCNVGISEGWDLRSAPLKWAQVARYNF
jgi:hypothetical protein